MDSTINTLFFVLGLLGLIYGAGMVLLGLWFGWYDLVTGGPDRWRGAALVVGGLLVFCCSAYCLKGVLTEAVVLGMQREAAGASVLAHPEGHQAVLTSLWGAAHVAPNPGSAPAWCAAPGGFWEGAKPTPPAMATTTHPYRHCDYCKRETIASNKYQRYERRAWTLYPTTRMFCCPECRARGWNDEHAAIRLKVRAEMQREQFGQWLDANDAQDAERNTVTSNNA